MMDETNQRAVYDLEGAFDSKSKHDISNTRQERERKPEKIFNQKPEVRMK